MNIEYNIPDQTKGEWKIETYIVKEPQKTKIFNKNRYVPNGIYKKLIRKNTIVMSNTPDELRDMYYIIKNAKGDILISGLGMGLLPLILKDKSEVRNITIIEISNNLIEMISPYLNHPKIKIIHGDIFEWKPQKSEKWDYIWHDIWDYISSDNVKYINKLHKKFKPHVRIAQRSWCEDICRTQLELDTKFGWR